MRLELTLATRETVPFDHLPVLKGAFHRWSGHNEALHDGISLYSLSWLRGGRGVTGGLRFERGATWSITAYSRDLVLQLLAAIRQQPELGAYGLFLGPDEAYLEVRRIALNMDQVREHDPPPNPTKATDTRAQAYVDDFGQACWELDALDPEVIEQLITQHVLAERDEELWQRVTEKENEHKELLATCHNRWDEVAQFLQR